MATTQATPTSAASVETAQKDAAAHVQNVATLAGLRGPAAEAVTKAMPSTVSLDDTAITSLVTSRTITDAQGKALGLSVALYALTDQNIALATAIQSASFAQLGGKPPASTADLAKLGPADWAAFLTTSKATLPDGATPQSAGVALAQRFAAIEPNVALFARLPQTSGSQLSTSVTALSPLLALNKQVVGATFTQLTTTGLTAVQVGTLQPIQQQLQQLSNAYPGLGLAALLDDSKTDVATKTATATRLIGLVQQVGSQLGNTQLVQLDLSAGSTDLPKLGLAATGATADEQTKVLSTLKAYQRVWAVTNDVDTMHSIVGAGFASAHSIGKLPLATFMSRSGLDGTTAGAFWTKARVALADTSLTASAIVDHSSRWFNGLAVNNQPASVLQYLAQLPGYQDLFGSLSFCDCDECQSIIGPAAYFVDLMKYIDDNLRNQFTTTTNPLDLKVRRPDLWTLYLSCDNTNTLVPTLDIVDQVLENYIALNVDPSLSAAFVSDRPKNTPTVLETVYKNTLTQVENSFRQPFYLPLARIASYLPALGSNQAAIATAVAASATESAQAELGLSTPELTIITTPKTDLVQVRNFYGPPTAPSQGASGIPFTQKAAPPLVDQVDAAPLGAAMGVSRADLGLLAKAQFVTAGGATVTIASGMLDPKTSVQNDVEWVTGLTVDALDRMHRFIRLARRTGWAIVDLDRVITAVGDATLGLSAVESVAHLHAIQRRFGLAISDLCAFVGLIPQPLPGEPAGSSLFDQLFNAPSYVALSGALPQSSLQFFHPSFQQGVDLSQKLDPPVQNGTTVTRADAMAQALPRLLMGLGVSLADLEALIRGLAAHLAQETAVGFNPDDPDVDKRYFVLSIDNLTLLYRHVRVARLFGISVPDFFQLMTFAGVGFFIGPPPPTPSGPAQSGPPASLTNLLALLDLWDWWRQSGYRLDDVAVATGQLPRNATAYADPRTVASQVVAAATNALTFADTMFAAALGTTEQGSLDLLRSLSTGGNPPLVRQSATDGSWSLVPGVSWNTGQTTLLSMPIPATAVVTTAATATSPAVKTAVSASAVLGLLQTYLAAKHTFTDVEFATHLAISQQGADDLLAALSAVPSNLPKAVPSLVLQVAGGWNVNSVVDISSPSVIAIAIPPTALVTTPATATTPAVAAPVSAGSVLTALQPYIPAEVLTRSLGTAFSFTTDKVVALAALAGQSLESAAVAAVVRGDVAVAPATSSTPDALTSLVAALLPLAVAFGFSAWNAPASTAGAQPTPSAAPIDFVRENPLVFGLPATTGQANSVPLLSLAQLRALSVYARFAQRQSVASLPGQPADLQSVLTALATPGFSLSATSPVASAFARLLGVPLGLVVGLAGPVTLPALAPLALDQLDQAAQLGATLGIDGGTLGALAANDYDKLSSAADALVLALANRYTDPATRATKLDEAERPIREAKRDALADYLISSVRAPASSTSGAPNVQIWSSLNELYEYFLIDVSAGGCASTSWVVSATMTAQLYVNRAILNLEHNGLPPSDKKLYFNLTLAPDAALEWVWRKNYRVWQANREVFLWPENYLDPDLRDDMTPLFKDLESQLLQTDINDQNVTDAYTTYLAGLEEVSSLKIAGAYHDISPLGLLLTAELASLAAKGESIGTAAWFQSVLAAAEARDVLHLFGATASDPPVYYYRTCANLIGSGIDKNRAAKWAPWQKINVQIPGRTVAPVVYQGRLHTLWADIKTTSVNQLKNGQSTFTGYLHTMKLYFTTLRPDATWSAPQQIVLPAFVFPSPYEGASSPGRGQVSDPLLQGRVAKYDPLFRVHGDDAIDDYTLSGLNWLGVWPTVTESSLQLQLRNFIVALDVDLFGRKATLLAADDIFPNYTNTQLPLISAAYTSDWQNAINASNLHLAAGDPTVPLSTADQTALNTLRTLIATAVASTDSSRRDLYYGHPNGLGWLAAPFANAVIDRERLDIIAADDPSTANYPLPGTWLTTIQPGALELLALPGSVEDAIVRVDRDILLLQGSVTGGDGNYVLRRLGTTLSETVSRKLFENGLDSLLATETQTQLIEAPAPLAPHGPFLNDRATPVADPLLPWPAYFNGPYGVYYWELFFHIPFLIANALNAQGRFDAAQRWYQYIFDPTSSEVINTQGVLPADQPRRLLDRVWRFSRFRGLTVPTLKDILTDAGTIALYKEDPFNPWAIARGRVSAFQKAILMKYVGNLLDWGDSLFTQFTMESVNEAMMLYVMAADILGPRPIDVGDCGAGDTPIRFMDVETSIDSSSDFLVELESWTYGARVQAAAAQVAPAPVTYGAPARAVAHAVQRIPLAAPSRAAASTVAPLPTPVPGTSAQGPAAVAPAPPAGRPVSSAPSIAPTAGAVASGAALSAAGAPPSTGLFRGLGWSQTRTASWGPALANSTTKSNDPTGGRSFVNLWRPGTATSAGGFAHSVMRQMPLTSAFCVPANAQLLALWDRVDDRLYKIRNCMDINGNLRQLALFAPPINPMDLVAMQAAGLSLEDVLGTGNGDLPPYRFLYLIERAKAYATTLSSFGTALLGALEKKDGEALNVLRLTQQLNLTQAMLQSKQMEIDAANAAYDAITQQLAAAQYRSGHYADLISTGRNPWEITQSLGIHTASGYKALENGLWILAAAFGYLPNAGSPFALTYGGRELNAGAQGFAYAISSLAAVGEAVAASAGLEASFDRRGEDWALQKQLADYDILVLTKQQTAAQIRVNIAANALDLQQKTLDQAQEFLDRTQGRFTNLGLYTWLSGTMQNLYRSGYQNALALANLALQAFQFERGDYVSPGLSLPYWNATYSGLLAGDQILRDLQTLERRFIETNYRTPEIEQPFSLLQIDPQALINLRENGECSFTIPEAYFDLFYPGHYKRRIKAVRVTIPCVTGPYTNVSATLDLQQSWIRTTPNLSLPLVSVPPTRSVSIATSTGVNDVGVFEFSFRDERYMPFEGLGAVSQWHLTLPKAFRQFDYETITDVILSISYTAESDGVLRSKVEDGTSTLAASLTQYFKTNVARRAFSLRHEFPAAYSALLRGPLATPVTLAISAYHFPFFAAARQIQVSRAFLVLRTASAVIPSGLQITVDGTALAAPALDANFGGLPVAPLPASFTTTLLGQHTLVVVNGGSLAPASPGPGGPAAIDATKLLDAVLYVEYTVSPRPIPS